MFQRVLFLFAFVFAFAISGEVCAVLVPSGQDVGSTFRRAKMEKKNQSVENALEEGRPEPEIEGEAGLISARNETATYSNTD